MKISAIITTIHRPHLQETIETIKKDVKEIITIYDLTVCPIDRANKLKDVWSGDFMLGINDRCTLSPGWIDEVDRCFKKINYHGIVNFNSNTVMNGVISRSFFDQYYKGYIGWPEYIRYYFDMELGHKARMMNCYVEAKGGILHTIEKKDATPCVPTPQEQVDWDKRVYYEREKKGFPAEIVCDMNERNRLANLNIFK